MDSDAVIALTERLAPLPRFSGAACARRWQLWDAANPSNPDKDEMREAQRTCLEVCASCRVRDKCAAWAGTLTTGQRREMGVVGGCKALDRTAP